jgi:hypothetical protein
LLTVVNDFFVPIEAIEQSEKRPFAALVHEAKAAARIAVFFVELAGSSRSRRSSTRKI